MGLEHLTTNSKAPEIDDSIWERAANPSKVIRAFAANEGGDNINIRENAASRSKGAGNRLKGITACAKEQPAARKGGGRRCKPSSRSLLVRDQSDTLGLLRRRAGNKSTTSGASQKEQQTARNGMEHPAHHSKRTRARATYKEQQTAPKKGLQ